MTDSTVDWDEFDTSPFVKFDTLGQTVSGVITRVYKGTDFNGNPCPVLDITTEDGEKVLSCGPSNLKAQMVQLKPTVGSHITVRFDKEENTGKGNPLKVFAIDLSNPLGATPIDPAAPAAPPAEAPF